MIEKAAIEWKGKVYSLPAPARHHDVIHTIHEATGDIDIIGTQGFLTSDGQFVGRSIAAQIAFEAGQTPELFTVLMSEDVW